MRRTMSGVLGKEGYTVRTAEDGAEGAKAATEVIPDLVVCDVHMPGMTGYEFLKQLRARPATTANRTVTAAAFQADAATP